MHLRRTVFAQHVGFMEWMHAYKGCCVSIRYISTLLPKLVILPMAATRSSLAKMGLRRIKRGAMWKPGSEIPIADLATRTRGRTRHWSSHISSRVTSGLTSLTVLTRPREIAIGRLFRRKTLGGRTSSTPSQTRPSISLLNINEEFCSAYVGRNDGYKRPSPRDFTAVTSPRLLLCDISATTSVRTTSTGSTSKFVVSYY